MGAHETIVYTYQAESRARLKIMSERALDGADAAGQSVEWTRDRPNGVRDSILVPEITSQSRRCTDAVAPPSSHEAMARSRAKAARRDLVVVQTVEAAIAMMKTGKHSEAPSITT